MAKYFTNIALQPANLASLKEAIINQVLEDEDFRKYVTLKKVRDNDPVAVIGEMDAVGKAGASCNPTFAEIGINNALQRWSLGDWEIALSICYENLEETIAEYCLKAGTPIGDLTDTDFLALYTELLATQMRRMIWRFIWFGDTAADHIADGGVITAGVDLDLIQVCDGFFKKLYAIATNDPTKKTTISANSQNSYSLQKSTMLGSGYAVGLVDTILMDADSRINMNGEGVLMLNKRFADALAHDVKATYSTIMPWEKVFEGFEVSEYDGVKVARIAAWDYMIDTYENTGSKWNLPYRAVFANPKNLLVGTPADDPISELDIWFNKDERQQKVYATGKIGTIIAQQDIVHVAY